ncbi:MAG: type II toxin-antitoxin system RelE/ParE family toxin [Magnetospiraceae bacterium]
MKMARDELVLVRRYIGADNPEAAQRVARRLLDAVESLRDHPGKGRPGRLLGTRELVIIGTPYIVLYRVVETRIEILRVMHGARKWPETGE